MNIMIKVRGIKLWQQYNIYTAVVLQKHEAFIKREAIMTEIKQDSLYWNKYNVVWVRVTNSQERTGEGREESGRRKQETKHKHAD